MKLTKYLALAMGVLMLAGAVQALADPSLNNGDDLVVCCQALIPPASSYDLVPGILAQATGCVAIDGSAKSINKCPGAVIGCSESMFACAPTPQKFAPTVGGSGTNDCGCAAPLDLAFPPKQ